MTGDLDPRQPRDRFEGRPTPAEPVRWHPHGGDADRWLPLDGALDRLTGYGHDRDQARRDLLAGRPLSTPYATYIIDGGVEGRPL